jgi:hypothetical protein
MGALTLGAAALVGTVTVPAASVGASSPTPQALYQSAIAESGTQSVHYLSRALENGVVLEVIGDTGRSSGSQVLVIESKSSIESLEVLLIGATGYVRGNATALEKIMGLSEAEATANLDNWLSFPAGDKALSEVVGGLRNADIPGELAMTGPYTLTGKKKIEGKETYGIGGFASTSGGGSLPMVLYVETGKVHRPVEEVTNPKQQSNEIEEVVEFSRWGEKNHPKAPKTSVNLATLLDAG